MGFITLLKEKIYAGEQITRQDAIRLQEQPLPEHSALMGLISVRS